MELAESDGRAIPASEPDRDAEARFVSTVTETPTRVSWTPRATPFFNFEQGEGLSIFGGFIAWALAIGALIAVMNL